MAVRLRPQQIQQGGTSNNGSTNSSGASSFNDGGEGEVSLKEEARGFLSAFRFERQGLAVDEYHASADAPYEKEVAKRVEAALSLSRPDDASEFLCLIIFPIQPFEIWGCQQ